MKEKQSKLLHSSLAGETPYTYSTIKNCIFTLKDLFKCVLIIWIKFVLVAKTSAKRLKKLRYLHRQKKYNRINHIPIQIYQTKYRRENRAKLNQYQSKRYNDTRMSVLKHYTKGDKIQCVCHGNGCKEDRIEKLVLEHVNGKAIHGHQGMSNNTYYMFALKNKPKGLNVMCQRCNASKRDGKVCRIHGTKF